MLKLMIRICKYIIVLFFAFSFVFAQTAGANNLDYDYNGSEYYIIKVSPLETISTKDNIFEGQKAEFTICEDVYSKGVRILRKGDIVEAKIETVVRPSFGDLSGMLVIDNFEIPNIPQSQLISEYTKYGFKKFWLRFIKIGYPVNFAIYPITRLVKGSHAKIKPTDIIRIYYFPDWK